MDTNIIAIIAKLMADKNDGNQNTLLIVGMVLAAITPTLAAIASWIQSRAAMKNTEEAKKTATETATSVKEIHLSVNSERAAMLEQVRQLRDEILKKSTENATLVEQGRAAAAGAAAVISPAQITQVGEAIKTQVTQVAEAIKKLPTA